MVRAPLLPIALLAVVGLLAGAASAQAPATGTREVGALVIEGAPETPAAVRERLRRYNNVRSAGFADWLADGSMLVATRFGSTAQLHRVAAPGAARAQLTFFDEPVAGAVVRPGTSEFVFARDAGGDEYYQGFARGLTGAEAQITEPGTRNSSFEFSRDGALLTWSRVGKGDPDYDIMVMTPGRPETRRVALEGKGAIAPLEVSPDGRRVLVGKAISNVEAELHLLDLASGRLTEIRPTEGPIRYDGGAFTADGRSVITVSDEGSDVLQLVRIDLADGRRSVLVPGLKWDVESFDLSEDGSLLAYSVNEDGLSTVRLMEVGNGRALKAPALPAGVLTGLKFSPDGRRLAIGLSAATATGDVYSWDLSDERLVRWTESEVGGLDPKTFVAPELVRFPSFDKRSIPAFVYKPKGRTGRLPVIVDIHGGPEAQERPNFYAGAQYWLNELGVAVITPNVRGSDGYGKAYINLDNAEKREGSVKDIGALLDWIAAQPDLDPERVVVYGGSYGGYMVLASLTNYPDRLAGGVDIVGISNWITFLTNTEGYRRDLRRAEYGDERDPKMRAVFERISPLNNAARIKAPLLVIQGDNDPRVPKSEADQIVAKVRGQGNEVWYLRAKNEGHGFRKKENNDVRREVETLFLSKVLGLELPGEAAGR